MTVALRAHRRVEIQRAMVSMRTATVVSTNDFVEPRPSAVQEPALATVSPNVLQARLSMHVHPASQAESMIPVMAWMMIAMGASMKPTGHGAPNVDVDSASAKVQPVVSMGRSWTTAYLVPPRGGIQPVTGSMRTAMAVSTSALSRGIAPAAWVPANREGASNAGAVE